MKKPLDLNKKRREERARALLGLTASHPEPTGKCPDSEELAELIEGNIQPEQKEPILAHIDACPECYDTWLTLRSLRTQESSDKKDRSGWRKIFFFKEQRPALISLALAACLLLFIGSRLLLSPPEQTNSLYQSMYFFHGYDLARGLPESTRGDKIGVDPKTVPPEAEIDKLAYTFGQWIGTLSAQCDGNTTQVTLQKIDIDAYHRYQEQLREIKGDWAQSSQRLLEQLPIKTAKPGQKVDCFDLQPPLDSYLLRMEDFQEQE